MSTETVVPIAAGNGFPAGLTINLHVHIGPPHPNGEPSATPSLPVRVTSARTPESPRIAVTDQCVPERRMSPPKPEPVGYGEGDTTAAPTDVANTVTDVLVRTGYSKSRARGLVEAAIGEGLATTESVLRRAFQLGRTPGTTPPDANLAKDEADREVLDREQCASIAAVSSRLTHRERVGFLFRLGGLSHRAVARRMNITLKAAEKQHGRVRRKLSVPDFDTFVERFRAHKANHGSLLCRECVWNCAETFASDNRGENI